MARTKFSELRDQVVAKPGATERMAVLRAETLEEIRLYELRHGEAISQAELAGRLDVTQGAWLSSTKTSAAFQFTWAETPRPDRVTLVIASMDVVDNNVIRLQGEAAGAKQNADGATDEVRRLRRIRYLSVCATDSA